MLTLLMMLGAVSRSALAAAPPEAHMSQEPQGSQELQTQTKQPRRFALVVGENLGDASDEPLQFAQTDAQKMRDVLLEVGGVDESDMQGLYGTNAEQLREALERLEQRLRAQGTPSSQLFIYISSHADEGNLRLQGTRFSLRDLNQFLRRAPVGVAVLIVDSCRSGALTRLKGDKRLKGLKPLRGAAVTVDTPEISGRVVISSSGPDEYSQESDTVGGSYFTHHLLAALRGAADVSRDGQVSLQEAYSYAYARTVETTFGTAGIQHPSYRVDLKGQGDLVLSAIGGAHSRLTVAVDAPGEWLVLSGDGRSLIGQFAKDKGTAVFALPPGRYRVRARLDAGYRETQVTLTEGTAAVITPHTLERAEFVRSTRKGEEMGVDDGLRWTLGAGAALGLGSVGGVSPMLGATLHLELEPIFSLGGGSLAAYASVSFGFQSGRAQGEVRFRESEWSGLLGAGIATSPTLWDRLRLHLGLQGGATLVYQDLLPDEQVVQGVQPRLGLTGGVRFLVAQPLSLFVDGSFGPVFVWKMQGRDVFWTGQGTLGAALMF